MQATQASALSFTVIVLDASTFGVGDNASLAGIHRVVTDMRDVEEILYSVDRDGFDRVFVYLPGYDAGRVEGLGALAIDTLCGNGGRVAHGRDLQRLYSRVAELLTMKQLNAAQSKGRLYRDFFTSSSHLSKRGSVRELCRVALVKCTVLGW